jgi:hypothetical protein
VGSGLGRDGRTAANGRLGPGSRLAPGERRRGVHPRRGDGVLARDAQGQRDQDCAQARGLAVANRNIQALQQATRDDQPAPQGQRANRSLAPPGAVGLTPDSDGLAAPHAQPHLDSRAEGEQTEIGGHVPVRGGQHADPEVAAHRWDASRCLGLRQDTASHR